jgi:ribonuclease HI
MKEVEIWSDGACSPNPGFGGWGAILKMGAHEKELSGSQMEATNNSMEMTGALMALRALTKPCKVILRTDSEYIVKCFNQNWISKWENNNWDTSGGTPVKNRELWEQLQAQDEKHEITWEWVKGHADNEYNNRCDELAVNARLAIAGLTPEQKSTRVLVSLKQALTRLRAAHKLAKEIELELDEEDIKQAKKLTSKLARDLDKKLKETA